jgi:hypothetical protein
MRHLIILAVSLALIILTFTAYINYYYESGPDYVYWKFFNRAKLTTTATLSSLWIAILHNFNASSGVLFADSTCPSNNGFNSGDTTAGIENINPRDGAYYQTTQLFIVFYTTATNCNQLNNPAVGITIPYNTFWQLDSGGPTQTRYYPKQFSFSYTITWNSTITIYSILFGIKLYYYYTNGTSYGYFGKWIIAFVKLNTPQTFSTGDVLVLQLIINTP